MKILVHILWSRQEENICQTSAKRNENFVVKINVWFMREGNMSSQDKNNWTTHLLTYLDRSCLAANLLLNSTQLKG